MSEEEDEILSLQRLFQNAKQPSEREEETVLRIERLV